MIKKEYRQDRKKGKKEKMREGKREVKKQKREKKFKKQRQVITTEIGKNKFGQLIDASFRPYFDVIPHFWNLIKTRYQPTNRRTVRPTDRQTLLQRCKDTSKKKKPRKKKENR